MGVQEQQEFQAWVDAVSLKAGAVTGLISQPVSGRTSLLYQLGFELSRRGERVLFVATEWNNMRVVAAQLAEVRQAYVERLRADASWVDGQLRAIEALGDRFSVSDFTSRRDLASALEEGAYTVLLVDNLNALHFKIGAASEFLEDCCKMMRELAQEHGLAVVFTLFIERPEEDDEQDERARGIAERRLKADDVWLISRNEARQDVLDLHVSNAQAQHAIRIGLEPVGD